MSADQLLHIVSWVTGILVTVSCAGIGYVVAINSRVSGHDEAIKALKDLHEQERSDGRDFRNRIESKVDKLVSDVATLMERSNHSPKSG